MVYTEYFARGTVPTDVCDLHSRRSFLGAIASIFRDDGERAQLRRESTTPDCRQRPDLPTASTSGDVAAVDPATATAAEPPKKKRGFWSRVFGIGGDDDKRDEKSDKNEKNDKNKGDKDKTDAGRTTENGDTIRLEATLCRFETSSVIGGWSSLLARSIRRGTLPPSLILAGPRRRQTSGCRRHRAGAQLPESPHRRPGISTDANLER